MAFTPRNHRFVRMSILSRSLATAAVIADVEHHAHCVERHGAAANRIAAQTAKTLNGVTWKDFRKAKCGSAYTAAMPASTRPDQRLLRQGHAPAAESSKSTRIYNTAPAGNAVLPAAVSPKYAGKSTGKARMLTCLDQYEANKAGNMNGGRKWIPKGSGYYSMCNKHLKGAGA